MRSSNRFEPDYANLVDAARNNRPDRTPLYEHIIDDTIMESVLGHSFSDARETDIDAYFRKYCSFFETMGYDTVSFETLVTAILPGAGALYFHRPGVIRDRADFERYPWSELPAKFFETFRDEFSSLSQNLPAGMKAVGGPGNGIFEYVQDLVGYGDLCPIRADDPELYRDLFAAVGELFSEIWRRFLDEFADVFVVPAAFVRLDFRRHG